MKAYTAESLLDIAEQAYPQLIGASSTGDFLIRVDDWQVAFFYRRGVPERISYFITPHGTIIDFHGWPAESRGRVKLESWRPPGRTLVLGVWI